MITEREHFPAASRSLVIASVSACNSPSRLIRSLTPDSITPGGAKMITGKCRSTIASGPWRKSADPRTLNLDDLTVPELRKLARDVKGIAISGREISKAGREQLVTELKRALGMK